MPKFTSQWGSTHNIVWNDRATYGNKRKALRATEHGEPFMTASVNLINENLAPDEMAIKDYAENEGVLKHLMDNLIVSKPIRYAYSGHVQIPIVKYLGIKHL